MALAGWQCLDGMRVTLWLAGEWRMADGLIRFIGYSLGMVGWSPPYAVERWAGAHPTRWNGGLKPTLRSGMVGWSPPYAWGMVG